MMSWSHIYSFAHADFDIFMFKQMILLFNLNDHFFNKE